MACPEQGADALLHPESDNNQEGRRTPALPAEPMLFRAGYQLI